MAAPTKLLAERPQLRSHSRFGCATKQHELSRLRLPTDVREAEEVERLRLSQSKTALISFRIAAETNQSCLVGMQLQPELLQSLAEGSSKSNRIALVLKREHDIVGVTDHCHLAVRRTLPPLLYP